ncbi:MAG: pyridoxal-phosphate dependent enzyme [Betaproteobacteria bacterium]|nr:pyridoxal-phosphate dependent enzyme [Betaproteobacteria bacterium]
MPGAPHRVKPGNPLIASAAAPAWSGGVGRAVLRLIREHGGGAIAAATQDSLAAIDELAREEGIFACPESATTLVGLRKPIARGWVAPHERVSVVTGTSVSSPIS